jgi:serine/threonine protein phosphatase PrpC
VRLGETAALSHPGRKRRHNEDSYVVQPPLFAVADGMGGAKAGEVASGLAAAAVQEIENDESGEARVAALIEEANRRVFTRATEDRDASGMGTTMTVALVEDDHVAIGHVGDSRAYLIRGGRLEQLTDDHSLVAELVRSGKLSPEEAESHPQRSVITRALGTEADVDVDTFSVEAAAGDLFLLCSDGLTTMVDDQTILDAVERHRPNLKDAAKALINAANRGGGEDNITVVFFELAGAADEGPDETEDTMVTRALPDDEQTLDEADDHPTIDVVEEKRRGRLLPILAAFAALLIIAAAVLWLLGNA